MTASSPDRFALNLFASKPFAPNSVTPNAFVTDDRTAPTLLVRRP